MYVFIFETLEKNNVKLVFFKTKLQQLEAFPQVFYIFLCVNFTIRSSKIVRQFYKKHKVMMHHFKNNNKEIRTRSCNKFSTNVKILRSVCGKFSLPIWKQTKFAKQKNYFKKRRDIFGSALK
jgi:hypothetical protein